MLAVAAAMIQLACGGSVDSGSPQPITSLSGNWQFTVTTPPDQSFSGGVQGGSLIQKGSSVTGALLYTIYLPAQGGGLPTACASGSAPVTGTVSGQTVTLTAVAGAQTFTFTGTQNTSATGITGTYSSTDNSPCGTAQTGLQWSAALVPPLTGSIQGGFHSTGGTAGLNNRDFPAIGTLTQGINTGASSTPVTGSLSFIVPPSTQTDYPCFTNASLSGQISGNMVVLQIVGSDGTTVGQIGGVLGSGIGPVTFDNTTSGPLLHSLFSPSYAVNTPACMGDSLVNPGDAGNICLGVNSATTCQQQLAISPASLTFPAEAPGSTSPAQTITLSNTSNAILSGVSLSFVNNGGDPNFAISADTCDIPGNPIGSSFDLQLGQSCVIKITFTPQTSCEASSSQCSAPLSATLTNNSPISVDNNTTFVIPITGTVSDSAMATVMPSATNRKNLDERR